MLTESKSGETDVDSHPRYFMMTLHSVSGHGVLTDWQSPGGWSYILCVERFLTLTEGLYFYIFHYATQGKLMGLS